MRRAQTSTFDLIIALSLLVVVGVLVAAHDFGLEQAPSTVGDAQALAQALFAPYPDDWNQSTVVVPGVVVDHRLDETLFARFDNLTNVGRLVGITSEHFVNTTLGTAGTPPPADAKEIHAVTRYAAHNGSVTPVEVVVWTD